MNPNIIAIVGPTACGKTQRAVELASAIDAEIISGDSRQVYKSMDIGTGKDLSEYGNIAYHLIDICDAGYKYNLHEYLRDFRIALDDIISRKKNVILCGGTGLYIESSLNGIQLPEVPPNNQLREYLSTKTLEELTNILKTYKTLHNTTDVDNYKRAIRAIEIQEYYRSHHEEYLKSQKSHTHKPSSIIIGLAIPREERRKRITDRLHARIEEGMIDEIKNILDSGVSPNDLIYYGLEYKFITNYVIGNISYQTMIKELEIAIHQFAKRQMTWFRGMEKRGFKINWIPYNLSHEEFLIKAHEIIMDNSK